jgi:prolyl-tRNA synthetase
LEYARNVTDAVAAGPWPAKDGARQGRAATVHIDSRPQYTPGYKYNEWELKGVPVRAEIGSQEVQDGVITLVRRDTGEKVKCQMNRSAAIASRSTNVKTTIGRTLDDTQKNLYQKSQKFLKENTHEVGDYAELKKIMAGARGFIKANWCGSAGCERKIKEETKATIRAIPLDAKETAEKCIYCGKSPSTPVFFAQAY